VSRKSYNSPSTTILSNFVLISTRVIDKRPVISGQRPVVSINPLKSFDYRPRIRDLSHYPVSTYNSEATSHFIWILTVVGSVIRERIFRKYINYLFEFNELLYCFCLYICTNRRCKNKQKGYSAFEFQFI